MKIDIEEMTKSEWPEGRSAGAAARELCRALSCNGASPTLQRLLETLLGDANLQSHDRAMILSAFKEADPEAAAAARSESFARLNGRSPQAVVN